MKTNKSIWLAMLCAASCSASAASYTVLDIGGLGGANVVATGLNNLGQVVGYATTASSQQHAFVTGYGGRNMVDIGTLGGTTSAAWAINDAGQVVGSASLAGNASTHAFVTVGPTSQLKDLGTLGGRNSVAYGINNAGQIAGVSGMGSQSLVQSATHVFVSNGQGALSDVGTLADPSKPGVSALGSTNLKVAGINAAGQIAGSAASDYYLKDSDAGTWYPSGGSDGYSLQGFSVDASGSSWQSITPAVSQVAFNVRGLNDSGFVVGNWASLSNGSSAAFVIGPNGDSFNELGMPGGWSSTAYDINNSNQIVGGATFSNTSSVLRAFVTVGGRVVDLNSLVDLTDGSYLTVARAINDGGQIVASASNGRTYLLSPTAAVPEPEAVQMVFFALGVIGLLAGRERGKSNKPHG